MKYAVLYAPKDLKIEEKPLPKIEPGKVLIKIESCGICGTDLLIYTGRFPVHFPYSPGHEYSGVVTEVGNRITFVKKGDRVVVNPNWNCGHCHYCTRGKPHLCENLKTRVKSNGGFAEYSLLPEKIVYKIPDALSLEDATLVEPLSCVLHALEKVEIKPSDRVVILGAGLMGLITLELLSYSGINTIMVSEPKEKRRRLAEKLGADIVVDPTKEDLISVVRRVNSYGADIVIDAAGLPQTIQQVFKLAKRGGTVVLLGIGDKETKTSISPFHITTDELTIKGSFLNPHTFSPAIDILGKGKIDTSLFITNRFSLSELSKAMDIFAQGEEIRIVIKPWI